MNPINRSSIVPGLKEAESPNNQMGSVYEVVRYVLVYLRNVRTVFSNRLEAMRGFEKFAKRSRSSTSGEYRLTFQGVEMTIDSEQRTIRRDGYDAQAEFTLQRSNSAWGLAVALLKENGHAFDTTVQLLKDDFPANRRQIAKSVRGQFKNLGIGVVSVKGRSGTWFCHLTTSVKTNSRQRE